MTVTTTNYNKYISRGFNILKSVFSKITKGLLVTELEVGFYCLKNGLTGRGVYRYRFVKIFSIFLFYV